ncbi:MAG: transcription-repair coupling factor [Zoogloeaceae bacterium]|nr:transcription-repair coupling factor [Zoogloeaceae bacterium]
MSSDLALLAALPALPASARKIEWPAASGSGDALLLAQAARVLQARQGEMLVVLTADAQDAARLREEISWFAPELAVHLLPDWEILPYDHFSPHQDIVSARLATLWASRQGECAVLLAPAATAIARLPPPAFLAAYAFSFAQGETLNAEAFRAQVTLAGYQHVTQVISPGEYAIRGGLIDLFPMGSALPYRLDLFDNEIESIRAFDVESQRTLYPVSDLRLLPAREFPLDDKGRTTFRQRFREVFEGDPGRIALYKDVSAGLAPAGVESWLPLFFAETASLFDYLPGAATLVTHGDVAGALARFWRETRSRYVMLKDEPGRPLLPPEQIFLPEEDFFRRAKDYARIQMPPPLPETVAAVAVNRRAEDPLAALKTFVHSFPGRVLLLAESAGRRETLAQFFAEHGVKPAPVETLAAFLDGGEKLALMIAPLAAGLRLGEDFAFISETELYAGLPRANRREQRQKASLDGWLKDLAELKIGDPVVHEQYGIGRYQGLVRMDLGLGQQEFLEIAYANEARLFVPVAHLHVISRYSGADPESAPLHTLGSGQWEKAKKKAALQARDTAAELLALYARRAARQGYAFSFSENDYLAFAEGFGFEETPDQAAAIAAVLKDMISGKPMDRLVCGDVGFGKTEVALRAAFCAAVDGKQVAVLCPTTLLCEQHYRTFADRFADWPIRIAELSRFKTAKESETALKELAEGKLDIVIGTHKLIAANTTQKVRFARLGLVIIDEEHRFGVRQKEALKALRAEVDVLTLTATPIPRTLAMSLEGLRDFSVIATAPQKRLAVKTFVTRFSEGILREAVLRELKRGGQVYFLHNEVATIGMMREKLEKLLPEARIVVGHGQMQERALERVMRDFVSQRANLLLCTTIIETGIDNPHANTILIHRADKFGLAQLHQLRGRVGRSHHQAYAYLLVDGFEGLKKQARQRLEAIAAMEDLGGGFYLAMHDLEIRGAGEVLGENQSGEMQEVGFNLFSGMLNRAVAALKAGKGELSDEALMQPLGLTADINLHIPALLPDNYCPDVHERLSLYKRLASCETMEALNALQEELIDRFGALPPQGESLLATHRLRLFLAPSCVQKLEVSADQITVVFGTDFATQSDIDPAKVIALIQKDRNTRLAGQNKLLQSGHYPTLQERAQAVRALFAALRQAVE